MNNSIQAVPAWPLAPGVVLLLRNPDALAADCLVNGDDTADYIGRELPKGNPVDADMAEYAQAYVDLVRAKVAAYEAAGYQVELEVVETDSAEHSGALNGHQVQALAEAAAAVGVSAPCVVEMVSRAQHVLRTSLGAPAQRDLLIELANETASVYDRDTRESGRSWTFEEEGLKDFADLLASASAADVPNGWKLVPLEVTA
jgi:hypothetical protein